MALKTISGNWSSRHLVSCRATTSTSLRSSQAATRSARERMELTFQVARRTGSESTERAPGARGAPLDLDGCLALGGHAGPQTLPALDEPRGLGVQPGQELGQLLA